MESPLDGLETGIPSSMFRRLIALPNARAILVGQREIHVTALKTLGCLGMLLTTSADMTKEWERGRALSIGCIGHRLVADFLSVLNHQLCKLGPCELQFVLSTARLPVDGALANQQFPKLGVILSDFNFNVFALNNFSVQRKVYFVLSHGVLS